MKTRYAVYKHGYVHEDESITDDEFILEGNFSQCKSFVNNRHDEFYIEQQEWDGLYWVSIENTRIIN